MVCLRSRLVQPTRQLQPPQLQPPSHRDAYNLRHGLLSHSVGWAGQPYTIWEIMQIAVAMSNRTVCQKCIEEAPRCDR